MAAETTGDKKGILLETGTNEFEIVEFSIGQVNYGINVAKVREVITCPPVTAMPQAHPYIDGLFTLRGKAIPLVNLPRCLNVQSKAEPRNVIVTEINNYNIGFLVENVSRIHRISWKDMEPAPEVGDQSRVVGIIKMEDRIVLLIDFETIIAEINPEINAKLTTYEEATEDVKSKRSDVHVVVAEDSPMLRDLLVTTLHESGYRYVRDFGNGQRYVDHVIAIVFFLPFVEETDASILLERHRRVGRCGRTDLQSARPIVGEGKRAVDAIRNDLLVPETDVATSFT